MATWDSKLEKEMQEIIDRGHWNLPGTPFARFEPPPEDAERFYELVELKAQHYWEEAKNAR